MNESTIPKIIEEIETELEDLKKWAKTYEREGKAMLVGMCVGEIHGLDFALEVVRRNAKESEDEKGA